MVLSIRTQALKQLLPKFLFFPFLVSLSNLLQTKDFFREKFPKSHFLPLIQTPSSTPLFIRLSCVSWRDSSVFTNALRDPLQTHLPQHIIALSSGKIRSNVPKQDYLGRIQFTLLLCNPLTWNPVELSRKHCLVEVYNPKIVSLTKNAFTRMIAFSICWNWCIGSIELRMLSQFFVPLLPLSIGAEFNFVQGVNLSTSNLYCFCAKFVEFWPWELLQIEKVFRDQR